MGKPTRETYLLRAVDAFRRRFIVVSPDFTILAAAECPEEIQQSDIIGKKCHEVFYDRSSACNNCAVKESACSHRPALRAKTQEGTDLGKLPCLYSYPIYSGEKIEAFVSMDFDLPTKGGIEETLQRSNSMLRNLIRSSVDAIIAADTTGKILIFNEAATNITSYTETEALESLNIRDIYPQNEAYEVMRKLRSEEFGGSGKMKFCQLEILDRDAEAVPISLNAAIVYEDSREVATVGFFHDMREQLQMKEKLEKTQIQLLQAEKMASLGKLAAGVAHQLNNPLGGITLYAKLILEEYELEEGLRNDLDRILKDAERCKDTVKELLEFARQTRQLMQPSNINRAIERTIFLLERQILFQNIVIEKQLCADLPLVHCDIQQINHMLMNIILNAAQAMAGKGELRIQTKPGEEAGTIRIEISDTGPGICEEALPKIFEPFFTTKEEGQGTGLGLSLVYGIVKNHNGEIKAACGREGCTTFTIDLPVEMEDSGDNT